MPSAVEGRIPANRVLWDTRKPRVNVTRSAAGTATRGQPPPPGKPGQKPLIDLIAELKLIKALQLQVNSRTKMYGDKEKVEQAKDPILRDEIRQLSSRQQKLQDMINKIANGENR